MEQNIPCWVDGVLRPMEKLAVHRAGLKHPAVSVFLICDGALLLQQRAAGKYHSAGLWANTCCTHPHWGEDAATCANRRMEEELGITGLTMAHRGQVEYRADVGGGMIEHEVVDLFVAQTETRPPVRANPAEVMATRWLALDTLRHEITDTPQHFTPWMRIYMERHLERITDAP